MKPLPSRLTFDKEFNFWSKIDRKSKDECWLWLPSCKRGVPTIKINRIMYFASRIAFYLVNKYDPGNKLVLHTCNTPKCMNNDHMYLGDHSDNAYDRYSDGSPPVIGNCRINLNVAKEIRRLNRISNLTQKEIGELFHVNNQTVSAILSCRIWKENP